MIIIDFETRSRCDLKACGADKYAADSSTEVLWLAATMLNDTRQWLWTPRDGALPSELLNEIAKGQLLAAVNARFDQAIWEYAATRLYGFPEVDRKNWYCIAAQLRVNALPASLDNASLALKTAHKKNHSGMALIRQLSIPDKVTGWFNEDPTAMRSMGDYCMDDALAAKDIALACPLMSWVEHRDWLLSEEINDRGVRIDIELATVAQTYAADEMAEISAEVSKLTGGTVTRPTQRQRVKDWIVARISPEALLILTKYDKGVKKYTLEKEARQRFFARVDDGDITVTDEVYNLMACYDDANKSSVAKFKRMTDMVMHNGRVCGAFIYAGASTLRFTSRGLQLHNFKRDCYSPNNAELLKKIMLRGERLGGVMDSLGKLLRPAIIPEFGHTFVVNDWSGIENRMLPWLSDDPRAQAKLDAFVEIDNDLTAKDTYERAAEDAGVTDRQIGKVIELSLGFLGANGAFNSMARNYGVRLPEHEVTRIVKAWRRKNPWAVDFGDKLEKAAIKAVKHEYTHYSAGRVRYVCRNGTLTCKLPSGTEIRYPDARVEVDPKFGGLVVTALKANWTPAAGETEWPRFKLWRGLLAENATQAECATLLREAISECSAQVIPIVLHCHDELVAEVPNDMAQWTADALEMIMENPKKWAHGLPLRAKPVITKRYGK